MAIKLFSPMGNAGMPLRVGIWLVYACLVTAGVLYHDPFNDEADPWVVARDTNFHDFIHYFAYAGHPPLWYLVLLPFARAGLPFETMAAINALFALTLAWLVLFRSPFSLWISILFLFSSYISYQYAVVARGYMLMILIFAFVAVCYPTRMERPLRYAALLAMLFITEIYAIIPAAVLSTWFTVECVRRPGGIRRYAPAVAIAAVGAAVALASMWPPDDIQHRFIGLHYYPRAFSNAMVRGFFPLRHGIYYGGGILRYVPGVMVLLATAAFMRRPLWLMFLLSWLGWFYFIFTCKYPGFYWHAELLPAFTICTIWLRRSAMADTAFDRYDKRVCLCLAVCLAVVLLFADRAAINAHRNGFTNYYSGGRDMGAFIRKAGYDHYLIASVVCHRTTAVSVYLPGTDFWIVGENRYARDVTWTHDMELCVKQMNRVTPPLVAQAARRDTLVLSTVNLRPYPGVSMHLLHFSPGKMHPYYLFTINVDKKTGGQN